MPPLFVPQYTYDDPTLTPPTPGKELIMAVGLVFSRPDVGPKTGGQYAGVPLSVGSSTTSLHRPHDGVEMRLPNRDLVLWNSPFVIAAYKLGIYSDLADRPGWEWLRWTLADHVAADQERLTLDQDVVPIDMPAGDAGPLVIVPCGARKRDRPAAAKDLYISPYHRLCLRAAHALTAPGNIRILSGQHGLLDLDTVIEPYNLRLGDPGSVTVDDILGQATDAGIIDAPNVVALAGNDYARMVTATWPYARTPLAGSRGIGDQQHRLARIAASGPSVLGEYATLTPLST